MKKSLSNPTDRDREDRARQQKPLSVTEPPVAGDFFRLKGGTYEVVRYIAATQQVVYRNFNNPEAEPLRDKLDALAGAYYVEAPTQRFKIDVAVHRADPRATTDAYHISIPGVFVGTWSGDVSIARGMWAYLWKEHGAALVAGLPPEEVRLFAEKLHECGIALQESPGLERAEVTLTGTRAPDGADRPACPECVHEDHCQHGEAEDGGDIPFDAPVDDRPQEARD